MGRPELDALPAMCLLVADELAAPVAGMHSVIGARSFRYTPANDRFVQHVHDAVVGTVYRAIPQGAALVGALAGAVWDSQTSVERPVSESVAGARWQAVVNAAWGDRLEADGSPLAVETSIRSNRRRVSPAEAGSGLGGERKHAVVLLHGLGQTESCWESPGGLWEALDHDLELVPVLVRYNSGRQVDRIGSEVAALVDALWQSAPRAGLEISLVGFSLGGLVARAAYAAAVEQSLPSASAVRHVVTVGSPHRGSYLARFTRALVAGLSIARTTRPLAAFLDGRSVGMRDLEWSAGVAELPRLPGVQHHFAAATITGEWSHPIGLLFGDLVVGVRSATAPAVAVDNVSVVGGRHHVDLLTDPEVRAHLLAWLRSSGDD